mmetsp:Transcript_12375/g.35740  ORF Transcript_12375/g.35740 Transcript_12375/m.35740 type:complete len:153 (-) Transcript_12375:132-590(-)
MLLASRRCPPFAAALRPAGTRALAFKATHKRQPKKEESSGGRDPYATLKAAIIAEPDPELSTAIMAEKETAAARRERRAEYSRQAITEVKRVMGHLSRLIKLRQAAIEALPEELQEAARKPDLTPAPIQRRIFTDTAPIPDYQAKLLRRGED